ncbi:MAG: SsrA-binding protein SmpB [Polyangiales bacterium]
MAKKKGVENAAGELLICRNPKATQSYEIVERMEAGMVLEGTEVKSLRNRRADLDGAYCSVDRGELYLHKMHIATYDQAGHAGHDIRRSRKLLMHRREIERLMGRLATKGLALVPISVYFKNGVAKVQLGLGRGRNKGDKRQAIREKEDTKLAREAMKR